MIAISSVLVAIATITSGVSVDPYARSHVSPTDPNSQCLWWTAGSVVYNQSDVGNPVNSGTEFGAVTRSWQSWQAIQNSCGNLTLSEGPHLSGTAGRTVGYNQSSGNNYNVVMFRQTLCRNVAPAGDPCFSNGNCNNVYDCWGNADSSTIGLTTTTFRVSSGQILDADLEFNAAVFHFTTWPGTSPTCPSGNYSNCVATDVQNTATHEFGHSLGLDHTTYPGSVMNPSSYNGETSKRTIDQWSGCGTVSQPGFIAVAYPQGQPSQPCQPVSASQASGVCTNASGQSVPCGSSGGCASEPGSVAWPLAALSLVFLRRRIVRA